ncbi:DUF6647 family protein [Aurantimonas coralicida]|uniref:DUF6647 family protein n=1 Tax=Aurantimonas coralicida TaxID=182270 RepID=UPI001E65722C|nr:DUF6647 family protein [Aurantimonas coralicida]
MHSPAILSAIAALGLTATVLAAAGPREAPPLLDAITLWLTANFDLPSEAETPALVTAPEAELVAMRYGPRATVEPGVVAAVYDDARRTIYLSESWTGQTPAELSVLVHEMVHHLQAAADMRFACPGEREAVAYHAQNAWLGLFGESLESAFGIDATTLLVSTTCTH